MAIMSFLLHLVSWNTCSSKENLHELLLFIFTSLPSLREYGTLIYYAGVNHREQYVGERFRQMFVGFGLTFKLYFEKCQ